MSRAEGSEPLPASSWAEEHGLWPDGPLFGMRCFSQAKALGAPALRELAQKHAVSTPGTLGDPGAWRLAGHRIALIDALDLADPPMPGLLGDWRDASLEAMMERAEERFDWPLSEELRHMLLGALGFALLFPELILRQAQERGREPWRSGLEPEVARARALAEKAALARSASDGGPGGPAARL